MTAPITAKYHRDLADAYEVEIQALALLIASAKRRRDAHREMEKFFTPPTPSLGTPLPVLPTAGPDPDFDDDAPGQEQKPDEAAP
jgi:hypothetical protein